MPRSLSVHKLAGRMQALLQLKRPPLLRLRAERSTAGGASRKLPGQLLEEIQTVGDVFESHGEVADGFLHLEIELPSKRGA